MSDRARRPAAVVPRREAGATLFFLFLVKPASALPLGAMEETPAGLALVVGFVFGFFAFIIAAVALALRERSRAVIQAREAAGLKARLERLEAVLESEPGLRIIFESADAPPHIFADAAFARSLAGGAERTLAFGTWAEPGSAAELQRRVEILRGQGEPFHLIARARDGRSVEARGRTIAGRAVLALTDLADEAAAFGRLLESLPFPVWRRDAAGRLVWVNPAYARAVNAKGTEAAATRGAEMFDAATRRRLALGRTGSVPAIFAGERRLFDVIEEHLEAGSAGIAIDVTSREDTRAELKRTLTAQARTLDQLTTAVAIFGPDRRLRFHNAAWRELFPLDAAWLATAPEDSAVLDRLRGMNRLPEQADYRSWKRDFLESRQARGPVDHWWHLPDGRTLRVVTAPAPNAGIVHVYEDHTARLELESRYNALIRIQRETLDTLREGVAVFGGDGRLRLSNPAFAEIWNLGEHPVPGRPHVDEILTRCRSSCRGDGWERIKAAATSLSEERLSIGGRIEKLDGVVLDYAAEPLPDGATLATFADVTANIAMQRALQERNDALEEADRLKTLFVRHVSYELRTPLTTVIGFAELLTDPETGPLNERQRDYAGHIRSSGAALLAIIDGILDLATIDAGVMELDLEDVDVHEAIAAAAEGLRGRLQEEEVVLEIAVDPAIGRFPADPKRLKQILFNLLSNAVRFSDRSGRISLVASRSADAVTFTVSDKGRGIPSDRLAHVFDRFEAWPAGDKRSGVGLGLALVRNFVELHGGTVTIESKVGQGTMVACRFPASRGGGAAPLRAPRQGASPLDPKEIAEAQP